MIMVDGPQLSQWDVGRLVHVRDSTADKVHFANQGDAKAVIMDVTDGTVKIPDYLLQTGKSVLAYEVLNGVTLDSRTFPVRKRERPETYVYEEDHRNYIYEWITKAEVAAVAANEAAQNANDIAEKAAKESSQAVDNANAAAQRAMQAANSIGVIFSATVE